MHRITAGNEPRSTSMSTSRIELAAAALREARSTRCAIAPISHADVINEVDVAYTVAAVNVDYAVAAGRRISGRKIGLTSFAVQKQLGVGQPDFGVLSANAQLSARSFSTD